MASLRRSKTMPADGQTAQFLYTILKQLDLKSIDWQLIANQLNITNGHAARMRYSRFKQHMEGTPTVPRVGRPKKTKENKDKEKEKGGKGDLNNANKKKRSADEMRSGVGDDDDDGEFGTKPKVKKEDDGDRSAPAGTFQSLIDETESERKDAVANGGLNENANENTNASVNANVMGGDGAGDLPLPVSVQQSVEPSVPAVKLENEEVENVVVKAEPVEKEGVAVKVEQ